MSDEITDKGAPATTQRVEKDHSETVQKVMGNMYEKYKARVMDEFTEHVGLHEKNSGKWEDDEKYFMSDPNALSDFIMLTLRLHTYITHYDVSNPFPYNVPGAARERSRVVDYDNAFLAFIDDLLAKSKRDIWLIHFSVAGLFAKHNKSVMDDVFRTDKGVRISDAQLHELLYDPVKLTARLSKIARDQVEIEHVMRLFTSVTPHMFYQIEPQSDKTGPPQVGVRMLGMYIFPCESYSVFNRLKIENIISQYQRATCFALIGIQLNILFETIRRRRFSQYNYLLTTVKEGERVTIDPEFPASFLQRIDLFVEVFAPFFTMSNDASAQSAVMGIRASPHVIVADRLLSIGRGILRSISEPGHVAKDMCVYPDEYALYDSKSLDTPRSHATVTNAMCKMALQVSVKCLLYRNSRAFGDALRSSPIGLSKELVDDDE